MERKKIIAITIFIVFVLGTVTVLFFWIPVIPQRPTLSKLIIAGSFFMAIVMSLGIYMFIRVCCKIRKDRAKFRRRDIETGNIHDTESSEDTESSDDRQPGFMKFADFFKTSSSAFPRGMTTTGKHHTQSENEAPEYEESHHKKTKKSGTKSVGSRLKSKLSGKSPLEALQNKARKIKEKLQDKKKKKGDTKKQETTKEKLKLKQKALEKVKSAAKKIKPTKEKKPKPPKKDKKEKKPKAPKVTQMKKAMKAKMKNLKKTKLPKKLKIKKPKLPKKLKLKKPKLQKKLKLKKPKFPKLKFKKSKK